MKKLFLATLMLATPVLGADSAIPQRVVREFVVNTTSADWWLTGGWTWNEGAIKHWAGSGPGVAELRTMPPLKVGGTYAIDFTHSGTEKGKVAITLGKATPAEYDWKGTFPIILTVSDPDALLTFTAANEYEGSISNIRVVELGEELVGEHTLTVTQASAPDRNPSGARLTGDMPIIPGHTYRVYFGVSESPDIPAEAKRGEVTLGGKKNGFSLGANYRFDVTAINETPLVFQFAGEWFEGLVSRISVREIVSDPVPSGAEQRETAGSGSR